MEKSPENQETSLHIRKIERGEIPRLWTLVEALGHAKDTDYFERCLERQENGELLLLAARLEENGPDIGYCVLNWQPKYAYFKKCGLPEIQDLNVMQAYRRRGYGRQVIAHCEELARKKGYTEMGIGVGLDASYGPAQRLYVKMGYIPDGTGISYDRKQVAFGEFRPVDDNLCLMMVKPLV